MSRNVVREHSESGDMFFKVMNKVARKKTSEYTTISNVFLRDKNLSLKAKGFLTVVMALPEDWDFSIKGICSILKEGKTAIYGVIQELKENHYCKTTANRDEKGLILGLDYMFYEEPYEEEPNKEEPQQDYPHSENLDMDNMPQLNTYSNKENNKIKDLTNKEQIDESIPKKERIDYGAIVKCWNETNASLSNVRMLNNKRKEQIRHLLASNNATVDDLLKAIKIISMSSFCQGKNDRNWKASFDWLINDTNSCFSRLFEGVYAFTQDEKNRLKQYLGETSNNTSTNSLPDGWTQERYDMFIRNGYTITEDGRVFKDGKEYK